LDKLGGQ